jgi:hypothetical protein
MYVKAKKKRRKESCLDYYLFSYNNSKREKRKSIFSLFFLLSIVGGFFFHLKAIEVITTNRNIGTGTAYNTIHTYIERPLAIFFYRHYFLSRLFALCTRFESSGVCIALYIVRTHPQAVISCHFITFIIILPKIPGR